MSILLVDVLTSLYQPFLFAVAFSVMVIFFYLFETNAANLGKNGNMQYIHG